MNFFQKNKQWFFFALCLFTIFQFFWVLVRYTTIESGKVFNWTIYFVLPFAIILSLLLNKLFTNLLFYSSPIMNIRDTISEMSHIKNRMATGFLTTLIICFLSYNTIIQTNDWFSKKEHYTFDTTVISVKRIKHGGGKSFNRNISYNVEVMYKGKTIVISTTEKYREGEKYERRFNVGGFWGVLFAE
jgi:hypothetical protein